jgi:hypothetical protein
LMLVVIVPVAVPITCHGKGCLVNAANTCERIVTRTDRLSSKLRFSHTKATHCIGLGSAIKPKSI